MIRILTLAVLAASPALATEGALSMEQAIALATQESRVWCEGQKGTLDLGPTPATAVDLTGDGTADDWIISEAEAFCGPDVGFLGGSGGALLHAVIGPGVQSWLGGAWALQDIAFTVEGETLPATRTLVLGLHGSSCDSFGAAPCMLALTWDGERLISYKDTGDE